MHITPELAPGRQLIQSYGCMRFTIAGKVYEGSVLVFPDRTLPWSVDSAEGITLDSLSEITAVEGSADLLVVGCGVAFRPPVSITTAVQGS